MTRRERAICAAILDYLHDLDGGQAEEISIHAGASERFMALIPKTEFDEQFKVCSGSGWLMSVPRRFGKPPLWSISDAGEKARLEMR